MSDVCYLSDVSPWWTMARQEAALRDHLANATVYRDSLGKTERRSHRPESLVERGLMLRPTMRQGGMTLIVASLAVLAWSGGDFEAAVGAVLGRGGTIVAIDDGVTISGGMPAGAALGLWTAARTKSRIEGSAKRGAANSAKVRKAAADAGIAGIADRWPLPSSEWSTAALLKEAGVSRNTVNDRLGGREKAQQRYQAQQKRKRQQAARLQAQPHSEPAA